MESVAIALLLTFTIARVDDILRIVPVESEKQAPCIDVRHVRAGRPRGLNCILRRRSQN